jgi:hypothetical protein
MGGVADNDVGAAVTKTLKASFTMASTFDPTGITGIIAAFVYEFCTAVEDLQ